MPAMARNRSMSPASEYNGANSGSPPPPLSKRDKKRAVVSEKLNDLLASFNSNLRPHYDAQISAVQVDMNLIMRADPYANKPLDDSGDDVADTVNSVVGTQTPTDQAGQNDFKIDSGKFYTEFVHKVNDAQEERDINLALLHNKYQSNLHELQQRHQFHVRLAHEERRLLATSVRERLVQHLNQKRSKLLKEKEQLDIGDTNAMLLYPNQFSINGNPASPGGPHNARKTRQAKSRVVDRDALPEAAVSQENQKKRKAAALEDDHGSPGPFSRTVEAVGSAPFHDAKNKLIFSQHEAPAYSIDRLFTEKELAMNMNTAWLATQNFLTRLKNNSANGAKDPYANGVNGSHLGDDLLDSVEPTADEEVEATGMERTVSHHATRGAAKNALADLANVADLSQYYPNPGPTIMPGLIGAKANGTAPGPSSLTPEEIGQDLYLFSRPPGADDALANRLLDQAFAPLQSTEVQYRPPTQAPENGDVPHILSALGGVPMSAQSSQGGYSEAGGVPMSRQGSGLRRTASGHGSSFLGVSEPSRRGRLRGI
ncbi:hypothetical protein K402DRAFT_444781 [Aulographum hederae CBS 113979]|uniref:Deacetylase complex subunit Sds3 n=1 Tax=Aulographum hederae CBS 113979 TaxID=1176131 RepID=A0A6G1H9D8_9PEZI|nr:hypothetical protein K402DRAFT_444781 [Aulographum hederae CBS 113979]